MAGLQPSARHLKGAGHLATRIAPIHLPSKRYLPRPATGHPGMGRGCLRRRSARCQIRFCGRTGLAGFRIAWRKLEHGVTPRLRQTTRKYWDVGRAKAAQHPFFSFLNQVISSKPELLHYVEVGTAFTSCPPHRSVRAGLPHTALVSGNDAQTLLRIRLADMRIR